MMWRLIIFYVTIFGRGRLRELEAYLADFEKHSLGKICVVCVCCNDVFKTYCFARCSIK